MVKGAKLEGVGSKNFLLTVKKNKRMDRKISISISIDLAAVIMKLCQGPT